MRDLLITVAGYSAVSGLLFLLITGVRTFDTHEASLYERLGGEAGVEGLFDDFFAGVADDERLGVRFTGIDMARLRALLTDWVCEIGGPCHYDDRGLAPPREGAVVTEDEFQLMMLYFSDAMFDAGVNAHDHFAAMHLFVDLHDDIVLR